MNPLINNNQNFNNAGMQSLKRMFDMAKNAQNPEQIMQSLAKQNPMVGQIMQNSGGDLKGLFYKLCEERGVNPNDILKQFE